MKSNRYSQTGKYEIGGVVQGITDRLVITKRTKDHNANGLDGIYPDRQHDQTRKEQCHDDVEDRDDNHLKPRR